MAKRLQVMTLAFLVMMGGLGAQCTGNGGNGRLSHSLMALGTTVDVRLEGAPGEIYGLWISSGLTTIFLPGVGFVCIDPGAPIFFQALNGVMPASGSVQAFFPVPIDNFWQNTVYWMQGLVTDPTHPSGFALTRAVRQDFELVNSHVSVSPMLTPRVWPRATTIEENGLVLVTGGSNATEYLDGVPLPTTEHYDPVLRSFFPGPTMATPRVHHTQTLLQDGRILITGGGTSQGGTATASCQVYDPAALTLQSVASMSSARLGHEAVRLDDGRVLVMGGTTSLLVDAGVPGFWPAYSTILPNAEIYDPQLDAWSPVPGLMSAARLYFRAVKLQDGRVLAISGIAGAVGTGPQPATIQGSSSCDLFDPATGLFTPTGSLPANEGPRFGHQATTILSGEVVLSGGAALPPLGGSTPPLAGNFGSVLSFDPVGETWSVVAVTMTSGTSTDVRDHSQLLLDDGDLAVFGGAVSAALLASPNAVLLEPPAWNVSALQAMPQGHSAHATVRLVEGAILTLGGRAAQAFGAATATAAATLYTPAY